MGSPKLTDHRGASQVSVTRLPCQSLSMRRITVARAIYRAFNAFQLSLLNRQKNRPMKRPMTCLARPEPARFASLA
jgi:hypothetical protein